MIRFVFFLLYVCLCVLDLLCVFSLFGYYSIVVFLYVLFVVDFKYGLELSILYKYIYILCVFYR